MNYDGAVAGKRVFVLHNYSGVSKTLNNIPLPVDGVWSSGCGRYQRESFRIGGSVTPRPCCFQYQHPGQDIVYLSFSLIRVIAAKTVPPGTVFLFKKNKKNNKVMLKPADNQVGEPVWAGGSAGVCHLIIGSFREKLRLFRYGEPKGGALRGRRRKSNESESVAVGMPESGQGARRQFQGGMKHDCQPQHQQNICI
jgi:hypothetical protein